MMRIGIDFDNTIICYDPIFCDLAKSWHLVPADYEGSKRALRDKIRLLPEGDLIWQRMQGQVYAKRLSDAHVFAGFKEFIYTCALHHVDLFIVSHKTELGHFDEDKINLREAARHWLHTQGILNIIPPQQVFFESTREEKIARIQSLGCTHFIDDLIEVLASPLFPAAIKPYFFNPAENAEVQTQLKPYSNWKEITYALFPG
jgi:hypothetical protein